MSRKISRIINPRAQQGFLGKGHTAIPLFQGMDYAQTDPFILLMDDQLNLPGEGVAGGPHPHAGFETVTLVLEGDSKNKSKTLQTGGLEWMTAGSGIVHTEEIRNEVHMRILQLWLVLPGEKRWMQPKWQELSFENVPSWSNGKNEARVYSGTSQGITSPVINETPTTIVDFLLDSGFEISQEIPSTYNGFIYVIKGEVRVGEDGQVVSEGQVGWLDRANNETGSLVEFTAGETGTRFIFYAGEPQRDEIISHGPFIGNTQEDIIILYRQYREGSMKHVNDLPESHRISHERNIPV